MVTIFYVVYIVWEVRLLQEITLNTHMMHFFKSIVYSK